MEQTRAQEVLNQSTAKAVEALTVWSEASQRALQEMAELSFITARESLRFYGESQQAALEVFRTAQGAVDSWLATWRQNVSDPTQLYAKAVAAGLEGSERAVRLWEGRAATLTRTVARLQSSAEQAEKAIQEALVTAAARVREVYARAS